MPWLTVLGLGSWSPGRDLPTFRPGSYEVDVEIAEQARASDIRSLLVTDMKPRTVVRTPAGPLTMDDLRESDGGVAVAPPDIPESDLVDVYDNLLDFPCGMCDAAFPSAGARERHIEFHHAGTFIPAVEGAAAVEQHSGGGGARLLPVLYEGGGADPEGRGRKRGKDWMNTSA